MNREDLQLYIKEEYDVEPDYPWEDNSYQVYRHKNKKWFALAFEVRKSRLGLEGDDMVDIVNLKCDPMLIGSLIINPGVYRAYHMNKNHWITVTLDGTISSEEIKSLIAISYELTNKK